MVKVNDKNDDDMQFNGYGPQSSLSSEGSFVVLERSPPQEPGGQLSMCPTSFPPSTSINGPQQLESQNSSFLPGSMPSDLSPEEIQKKLNEVLQENVELKETLHQNNLAMKQQFNTLVMWQDEVFKVHQSHKEKFAETKDLILKLRAENAELRNYLEQSKAGGVSDAQLKAENASLKGQIAELQQKLALPSPRKDLTPSRKERELSELSEQLNRQLENAERSRRQLVVDNERLTAQHTRLEREAATIRTELEEQRKLVREIQEERDSLQVKLTQHQQQLQAYTFAEQQKSIRPGSSSEEVQQLKAVLNEQCSQVEALQQQLLREREAAAKQIRQQSSVQTSCVTLEDSVFIASNLKGCEENLQQFNTSLEKQTERYASLDSWLQVAAENVTEIKGRQLGDPQIINNLRAEINELRKLLSQEQAYGEEKKQNLLQAQSKFQTLFTDYHSLMQEWESYHEEQKDKTRHNNAYYDVQARGFAEKIDGMTAQLLCKDEELALKTKEVTQLTEKVKKLEIENEAITILKAQVEVYQSDFNAEREARENLAGEKERLSEDVRQLQRRNQQLLEQLEKLPQVQPQHKPTAPPNNGWSTIATPGRTAANSRNQRRPEEQPEERPQRVYDEEVPPPKEYFCPKCNMGFRQLGLLEYHVETCLELTN